MKVVEVVWRDACLWTGKRKPGRARRMKLAGRRTVGYLVRRTTRKIILAVTRDADGTLDDVYVIPFAWTTKVRYLRKGRTR